MFPVLPRKVGLNLLHIRLIQAHRERRVDLPGHWRTLPDALLEQILSTAYASPPDSEDLVAGEDVFEGIEEGTEATDEDTD